MNCPCCPCGAPARIETGFRDEAGQYICVCSLECAEFVKAQDAAIGRVFRKWKRGKR